MEKKTRIFGVIYFFTIFAIMFLFFTKIHPIILFDVDDWKYISIKRHPIPLWGDWNPTRVFPEVFMPLCGDIAAFILYPLTGNYIGSFTLVNGAAVSLFIVLYLYMFFQLLHEKLKTPAYHTFVLTTIFLLLHFLVFISRQRENEYLFLSPDATCYYYYLIPALLNCSLVMYLMRNDVLENGWEKITSYSVSHHIVRNGILLLGFYMALFSNLYESAILAAFIGTQLLFELVTLKKSGWNLKAYIKKNILRVIFIGAWLVEQLFEVNGGRARQLTASLSKSRSFADAVMATLRAMFDRICAMNKFFLLGSFLLIVLSISFYGFSRIRRNSPVKKHPGGYWAYLPALQFQGF